MRLMALLQQNEAEHHYDVWGLIGLRAKSNVDPIGPKAFPTNPERALQNNALKRLHLLGHLKTHERRATKHFSQKTSGMSSKPSSTTEVHTTDLQVKKSHVWKDLLSNVHGLQLQNSSFHHLLQKGPHLQELCILKTTTCIDMEETGFRPASLIQQKSGITYRFKS